jgi:SPP1 gp7 family putative phage head morphogenesis protein
MFGESLPLLNYPDGVIGPPWRVVKQLTADALALDPPRLHDCHAVALFSPSLNLLVRCRTQDELDRRVSCILKRDGNGVIVLKGAIQLTSGAWYWPFATQRVLVSKALDPLKSVDRAKIANKLQASLIDAGRGAEATYLDEALDMLDVNWGSMSPEQIDAIVAETRLAASMIADNVGVKAATTSAGATLISTGELSRRAPVLGITESFARPDRIAVRRIASQMPFFISGDYARRAGAWEERDARAIIARGLRRGFDEREISKALHAALSTRVTNRSEAYYRMLANVSVGRASSFGQLTGYRDADIRVFEWEAVMDGATCNICRFLHGTRFNVQDALDQFARAHAAKDPERGIMEEQPWFREVGDRIHVAPMERGGKLGALVATVLRSAVGREDQRGSFKAAMTPGKSGATQTPPAHGLCRCITVPVE